MAKTGNCTVIEIYKGITIKKSNIVRLRLNPRKYKELIDEVEKTNLSMPKIIAYSGKPCFHCKGVDVSVLVNDKNIKIKRGILSDYTIMNSGKNIISQHGENKND